MVGYLTITQPPVIRLEVPTWGVKAIELQRINLVLIFGAVIMTNTTSKLEMKDFAPNALEKLKRVKEY